MGRSRYKIHEEYYPYFITCTAKSGLPLFSIPAVAEIILKNLLYVQRQREVTLYGYVIMENHFHAIVLGDDLSKKLRLTKSFMARQIVDLLQDSNKLKHLRELQFRKLSHKKRSDYQVWEEGFYPKQINSDKMMIQILEYIHFNPVVRGFVDSPIDWRYSSARNYNGEAGLIPVTLFAG